MKRKMHFLTILIVLSVFAPTLSARQQAEATVADSQQTKPAEVSNADTAEASSNVSLEFLNLGETPTSVQQLRAMESHVAELAKRIKPAVVNVRVGDAQGSGVVVSRDGYILTAAHVIGGPNRTAFITFPDGKNVTAKTLGVNRRLDSGMLKITDKGRYPYLDIGESELLNRGQWMMAIGHPGGIDKNRGLVVRIGRLIFSNQNVLRSDCTLVGGDSGGPLIDMDGYVVGIHSRIGASVADNVHVPIDVFSIEWDQLADGKRVGETPRPRLGFDVKDETNEVANVADDSPAEKAGLKKGDVIIKIEGRDIKDKSDVKSQIKKLKPGDTIKIVVRRDDDELSLDFTVGEQ